MVKYLQVSKYYIHDFSWSSTKVENRGVHQNYFLLSVILLQLQVLSKISWQVSKSRRWKGG